MDQRVTDIERAFQLAKSGTCASVEDIKKRLRVEGRSLDLTGRSLSKQLKALIEIAPVGNAMLKGPKAQNRPADVFGNAIKVARITTGEEMDDVDDDGKDKAAVSLGRRGGKARAEVLPAKKRSEIAKAAAKARWSR